VRDIELFTLQLESRAACEGSDVITQGIDDHIVEMVRDMRIPHLKYLHNVRLEIPA
jgi:hypothetical protein